MRDAEQENCTHLLGLSRCLHLHGPAGSHSHAGRAGHALGCGALSNSGGLGQSERHFDFVV